MINPIYYLPGSRRLWLGLFVLVVVVPLGAWQTVVHYPRWSFVNVALGCTRVEGVAEAGFHFQEFTDSVPFRWTNGKGRLLVPIDPRFPPQRLWVSLDTFRPKPTTVRLQILVDDAIMFDGSAPLGPWQHTVDLAPRQFAKQVLIELRSTTFVPKGVMDRGTNSDTRVLGVQVKGIMLQRDK